jgi:hypothetical protein
LGEVKEKIKFVIRCDTMDNSDGGTRLEEETGQQSQVNKNSNFTEMRLSNDIRERGKKGSYGTTVKRERMEPPRSIKDNTKQQEGRM